MKLSSPKSKHIAKATQANASTKALSKSLLCRPEKKNKKISPASQKLNLPTHKPTDKNNIDIQTIKHGRKKNHYPQHCIRAIAGEVVKSRSVHLINFCGGGQVIALKSATTLILDRWR